MFGIDWIVAYYIGILIRLVKERRSASWPVAQGAVYKSSASGLVAHIVYTYIAEGERYTGQHARRFWYGDSAEAFTELYPPGTRVTIRYRAGQPEKSIMRSQDEGKREKLAGL